ncbi:Pectinesterase, catalytic [Gossypium australe]|uniref:Pectinesterase n=1 Tax=Gossypium australe TaxID=47621 RepID=A0A5B6UBX4_9ROSI|nr:Pectinesterase, catalytic [Gossypium australe]
MALYFTVLASDFVGRYLTIQNTYGPGAKAVALRVSGDRASFFGCRILSYQDTLLDDTGRHYYSNCYIEGAVDFIFGNAASLFERCHLHTLSEGDASITAQQRESPSEETGFTFLGCKITGVRTAVLGRPWGPYSRVIFALIYMSNVILSQGWDDWGDSSKQSTVFYREYKRYGPGANNRKRVEWSQHFVTMAAFIFFVIMFTLMASTTPRADAAETSAVAVVIRVDQSGKGDYKKIQDAIDAVPSNNKQPFFILVKPGIYNEKIIVPGDKPFITVSGSKTNSTNTFRRHGIQAVALRVSGDRVVFLGCKILGYQDTLLDENGAVDFICGNAASLFERCHLHTLSEKFSAITAQQRGSPTEETGFTFLGCKITGERTAILGRPWGSYSRVIFALTYMSNVIQPRGWDDWGDAIKQSTVFYKEYKCYGPGANTSKRVEWSQKLAAEEAKVFLTKSMIGGKSWIRSTLKHVKKVSTAISNNSTGHS